MLRGACSALRKSEATDYEDAWIEELGLARSRTQPTKTTSSAFPSGLDNQTRLGGLPRLDAAFDTLIAHRRILPFLREFMEAPQLVNTWSISKRHGHNQGGFHAGAQPHDYAVDRSGKIHSKMLNVIWMLTDNGIDDGCVTVLPGSHKSAFPIRDHLFDSDGNRIASQDLPGAVPMLASAGSVLVMSECTLHTGLPKTTSTIRSNLYYNYLETNSMNPMSRAPYFGHSKHSKLAIARNSHHFLVALMAVLHRFRLARARPSAAVPRGAGADTLDGVGSLGPLMKDCVCGGRGQGQRCVRQDFLDLNSFWLLRGRTCGITFQRLSSTD